MELKARLAYYQQRYGEFPEPVLAVPLPVPVEPVIPVVAIPLPPKPVVHVDDFLFEQPEEAPAEVPVDVPEVHANANRTRYSRKDLVVCPRLR